MKFIIDFAGGDPLVQAVTEYVRTYMASYDASHDFDHIQRVVRLAHHIYSQSPSTPALDWRIVTLSALLHDVGDRKYLKPGDDATTMVYNILRQAGAPHDLAQTVQTICVAVSFSSECRDPFRVRELIRVHPELAVVQDADRIDAIGAIGIGRVFAYGGAKAETSMEVAIHHVEDKLLRIEGIMKTETGRKLAKERSDRLRLFRQWWRDEEAFTSGFGYHPWLTGLMAANSKNGEHAKGGLEV